MTQDEEIVFVVPGIRVPGAREDTIQVQAMRGATMPCSLPARPGEDVVRIQLAGGPELTLHPENARDLILAQQGATPRSAAKVEVPVRMAWRGASAPALRGGAGALGEVIIEAFTVVREGLAAATVDALSQHIDDQVDAGLYPLSSRTLGPLKGSAKLQNLPSTTSPSLIFLHGTFVETSATFGPLWKLHAGLVEQLFRHYEQRVYAFDHPTLRESPIENALQLARVLPANSRLHIVAHSRGGLVAEVMARAASEVLPSDTSMFEDDAHAKQRDALLELSRLMRSRNIHIDRIVRVASPIYGTLLASRRLDAYLSVLKWCLELGGAKASSAFVGFLEAVAKQRSLPKLRGLEAMMPKSPLVQWLNQRGTPVDGSLRVVSGDLQGDTLLSWLLTLVSNSFYYVDNDLVVQTQSMYGGVRRKPDHARFFFDRGGDVTHFAYFSNAGSANAIVAALTNDQPEGFSPIGPRSWAGKDSSGLRAAPSFERKAGQKPRPKLVIVPGIFGSHLAVDGRRRFIDDAPVQGIADLAWSVSATPDGVVEAGVEDLRSFMAATYDVHCFAYDWRQSIETSAAQLAKFLDQNMSEGLCVLAHSTGGLVVRAVQWVAPQIWQQWLQDRSSRLLMLGTPHAGFWTPLQLLTGDDPANDILRSEDVLHFERSARDAIATWPGVLEAQAGLDDEVYPLRALDTWRKLQSIDATAPNTWHDTPEQCEAMSWPVPGAATLEAAVSLQAKLRAQLPELAKRSDQLFNIVGAAPETASGVRGSKDCVAFSTVRNAGDGRVTHASGTLQDLKTFLVRAAHSELLLEQDSFVGYRELLQKGETNLLSRFDPEGLTPTSVQQSPQAERPSRAHAKWSASQRQVAAVGYLPLTVPMTRTTERVSTPLRVTIENSNLKFVAAPILIGHYVSRTLTGSERDMDLALDRALSRFLRTGIYPNELGRHEIFENGSVDPNNPLRAPRPEAVIVVGLGEEGHLNARELAETIVGGVVAYAQRISTRYGGTRPTFELATTLVGTGGARSTIGGSAPFIVEGVRDANVRLRSAELPVVTRLRLVEKYLDRAREAHAAVQTLWLAGGRDFKLDEHIARGDGALQRPFEASYRGLRTDFVSVSSPSGDNGLLSFALETSRARTEIRAQSSQVEAVRRLVNSSILDRRQRRGIGKTLFREVVPIEIEPFLSGTQTMVLELDDAAAALPWELLDDTPDVASGPARAPWAIRSKLIRKLRTPAYRESPTMAGRDGGVLVIGAPKCPKQWVDLPAAIVEARAIAQRFGVEPLLEKEAAELHTALLSPAYRIVHITGHGDLADADRGRPEAGVMLSDETVLGGSTFAKLRSVPDLVFVNCCHLGQITSDKKRGLEVGQPAFASSVASALIGIGVRCVVAAGWSVEDNASRLFAESFYAALQKEKTFIEAVAEAREQTWRAYPNDNTWAAYQCYGDPDWQLGIESQQYTAVALVPEDAPILCAQDLIIVLETMAAHSKYEEGKSEDRVNQLRSLQLRFPKFAAQGSVAEAFGAAYREAGDLDAAIDAYDAAVKSEDGCASFSAIEQWANLKVRRAGSEAQKASKSANGDTSAKLKSAQAEIAQASDALTQLLKFSRTVERLNLLGSAAKRRAMVASLAGNKEQENAAIGEMLHYYEESALRGQKEKVPNWDYPATNSLAARIIGGFGQVDPSPLGDTTALEQHLRDRDDDFWAVVARTELRIYQAVGARELAKELDGIVTELSILRARVPSRNLWNSVADQQGFVLHRYLDVKGLGDGERGAAQQLMGWFAPRP